MIFIVEYTRKDGERVTGQRATVDNLTKIISDLMEWGCYDIIIKSENI